MESYSTNTIVKKTVKKTKKTKENADMIEMCDGNANNDIVFPDSNWDGLSNGVFNVNDIIQEFIKKEDIKADDYGNEPIVVMKKNTYTQAHRKAQQKYREKFPDKYCETQRKLYEEKKKDDEWKKKFNERSRMNNEKYRIKKRQEMLEQGVEFKPRGRPRKNVVKEAIEIFDNDNEGNMCVRCQCFVKEQLDSGYCKKCAEVVWEECKEDFEKN